MSNSDQDRTKTIEVAERFVTCLKQDDSELARVLLSDLESLLDPNPNKVDVLKEVGKITRQIHDTLRVINTDSKLEKITESEVVEAKDRLNYAITQTEQAVNSTMDTIEHCRPKIQSSMDALGKLQEQLQKGNSEKAGEITSVLLTFQTTLSELDTSLQDIFMAQSFQDLTGQAIKRVIDVMQNVEDSLVKIIRIVKTADEDDSRSSVLNGQGPSVKKSSDSVGDQDDVDKLLSDLGF